MIPSPAKTVPSSATLRMRRSRERQRQGSTIISLEIGPSVISELVALEWLDVPDRGSKKAISRALTNLIEQAAALRVTPESKGICSSPLRATGGTTKIVEDQDLTANLSTPLFKVDPFEVWAPRLDLYARYRMWMPQWGPRPDQVGCIAPAEILEAYGFRPSGSMWRLGPRS